MLSVLVTSRALQPRGHTGKAESPQEKQSQRRWKPICTFACVHSQHHLIVACVHLQEPRAESAPKRASCVITGRHPNTPRQVAVVCRQLTGTLVLGDCCQQLKILHNGSEMAPPDFEAAAGCSKGKNWKVSNRCHLSGDMKNFAGMQALVQDVTGQACMMLCMLTFVSWHSMTVAIAADPARM